jgi:hypothetical protein
MTYSMRYDTNDGIDAGESKTEIYYDGFEIASNKL